MARVVGYYVRDPFVHVCPAGGRQIFVASVEVSARGLERVLALPKSTIYRPKRVDEALNCGPGRIGSVAIGDATAGRVLLRSAIALQRIVAASCFDKRVFLSIME